LLTPFVHRYHNRQELSQVVSPLVAERHWDAAWRDAAGVRCALACGIGFKCERKIAFAHQIAKRIKEKYGTTLELLMPIGGTLGKTYRRQRLHGSPRTKWRYIPARIVSFDEIWRTI
jgi:hypothetical protein